MLTRLLSLLFALFTAAPSLAQSAAEITFAKTLLRDLQFRSFEANREFCGTIGLDRQNRLVASRAKRGWKNSCRPRDARAAEFIIASYHTHGAFDPRSDAEVPSVSDLLADMDEGQDGWVSTPGGRLWYIDGAAAEVRQICGVGCLPVDPNFEPGYMGTIPQRFTLWQLEQFFGL